MFYYVTAASGEGFIKNLVQYAVKSLLLAGVSPSDVHVVGNTEQDCELFKALVPELVNVHKLGENIDVFNWKYMGGKRRYAVLKSASIHKLFPEPIPNKYLVMFDGDVLFYKNPYEFLKDKTDKTWFHHGKGLEKRSKIPRSKVNMKDYKSVAKWCRPAFAYLLVKWGVKKMPEREVNSGFYVLHPRDHSSLPKMSYKGCKIIANKFRKDGSAGEQCPLNAALCKLKVDWSGGSRFFCLDHEEYFDHFFGDKEWKKKFKRKLRELKI